MKAPHLFAAALCCALIGSTVVAATPPAPPPAADPKDAEIAKLQTQVQVLQLVTAVVVQQRDADRPDLKAVHDAEVSRFVDVAKASAQSSGAPSPSSPASPRPH